MELTEKLIKNKEEIFDRDMKDDPRKHLEKFFEIVE